MGERSFIVRIYRFDNDRSDLLAGIIQMPESEVQLTFRGMDELWDALKVLVKQGYIDYEND